MTSEIVILITELRNKQRITLPAGSYRFGRSAQCEYVLRRNNVGDHQFTVSFANGPWGVTDGGSDYRTWYNNRYLEPGETSILQSGDVVGLNTDGAEQPARLLQHGRQRGQLPDPVPKNCAAVQRVHPCARYADRHARRQSGG